MKYLATLPAAALALGLAGGAGAETYRLQTSQNAGDFTLQYLQNEWVPKLTEMTGGAVELELLPTGSVVPPAEGIDAVAAGILDGLHDTVSRSTGKDPAYGMFADMVAAYDNADQGQTMCMNAGGKEFLQKLNDEYTGGMVHIVGCSPYTRESLPSSVPIRSVADLEGLKIRAPEGLPAELFKRAGATSVPIPFSEVYTSLEKGVIDAADASAYVNNDATGIHKVAPYPIYPGIHSQAILFLAFNKDVWDGFTPEQQHHDRGLVHGRAARPAPPLPSWRTRSSWRATARAAGTSWRSPTGRPRSAPSSARSRKGSGRTTPGSRR